MNPTLKEAIENLYQVFEKYPLTDFLGCPCCVTEEETNILKSKKLRELTPEDLERYIHKAITTWGEGDDFKHFLPRILDLLATLEGKVDEFMVFEKMNYHHWQAWNPDEVNAIHHYLKIFWQTLIATNTDLFDNFYEIILGNYPNIEELLTFWEDNDSKYALQHLAKFIYWHTNTILDKSLFDSKSINEYLHQWLFTGKIEKKLWEGYEKYQSESFIAEVAKSYDILVSLRK